jgi:tRNA(fMet)-specific endonuclease VapC
VIAAINQRLPSVGRRLEAALLEGVTIGVPVVAIFEMWYGIRKSARPKANLLVLAAFLRLEPFEPEDADEAGHIWAALERAGTPIGPYEVLIAGQARRRNAILVTAITAEFSRVPGLRTEDWVAVERNRRILGPGSETSPNQHLRRGPRSTVIGSPGELTTRQNNALEKHEHLG